MRMYKTNLLPLILALALSGMASCRPNSASGSGDETGSDNAHQVPTPDNKQLETTITAALARHSEIDTRGLKMEVEAGYVTLSGQVSDAAAKERVKDVIQEQVGVRGVIVTNLRTAR